MTDGPASLHDRLWSELTGRILSGEWAPGCRIPSEHELAAAQGCSRATVGKVMVRLVDAGLIERRRKAGSFVRRPQTQSAVLRIADIGAEVEALGRAYGYRLIARARRPSDAAEAARTGLERGTPVLDLSCCHLADGRPFCHEARLINLEAVPAAADADLARESPGAWLLREVPWTSAEHLIGAAGADGGVAAALGLPPGAPCLTVDRRTWSGERPVTAARLHYPAGAHRLVARFEPST